MGIYNLSTVASTADAGGALRYEFNINGDRGRPLVFFAVDKREEADAAHAAMRAKAETATLIAIAGSENERPRPKTGFR
jgi:hypothetical protein